MIFSQIQHGLLPYESKPTHPPIYLVSYLPIYYPPCKKHLPTYLSIFSHLPTYILTYIFHFCTTYLLTYPPTNILFISLSTHLPPNFSQLV
jgi:hypothetical protein